MTEARGFVRLAAVLVGLANLVVLAHFFGGNPALPTGVSWGTSPFAMRPRLYSPR